jgi:CRP/FNR family transcriptional regulator, nitrogen fixation regulation protein
MSISETQVSDAPFIAFHARFGASNTFFEKDQEIYSEYEPAHSIYEVIGGAIRSYKGLSDGRRQICAFHLPGDVFGLENGASYRFTAEAIVDTNARVIRRHSLEYVATHDLRVTNHLLSLTAKTLLHAENHMLLLGRKNSLEKVAAFLLEMDHRLAGIMLTLPMSRRDIADYLGLTLETVSRALSYLRDKRVLGFSEVSQREIVLQDRQRLQEFDC